MRYATSIAATLCLAALPALAAPTVARVCRLSKAPTGKLVSINAGSEFGQVVKGETLYKVHVTKAVTIAAGAKCATTNVSASSKGKSGDVLAPLGTGPQPEVNATLVED
jgi:hypothetical protein